MEQNLMELWPHQTSGVAFALREKKVAWWDDTGTGKTATAIALADAIEAKSVLTLSPVIALEHWKAQFAKHGRIERSVALIRDPDMALHANVIVVPFSLISKYPRLPKRLRQYRYDLVIIDEAHALMSMDSERTRSIYAIGSESGGIQDCAPYVVLLSATLSPNGRPNELYPHLRALRPELLGPAIGYDSFVSRYCVTKFNRGRETIIGPNKLTAPELKRIITRFARRVRKRDVQKDLPPIIVDAWPVNVGDLVVPPQIMQEWQVSESALARDIGSAIGEEALAIARSSPHAATNRRLTGLIKTQAMSALLEPELAAGRKVISFAYHRDVLAALEERFKSYGVVTLDGSTSPTKRVAYVKDFREKKKPLLFNGQLTAAGEVIDLTGCNLMWIMESDWVPKSIVQAIGRANRPGQTEPLMVWLLTLSGSIDDALTRTLVRKTKDIETLEPV
jgi:SWI/SNF-related matrix-associated actin-dependent regulator of chromatin subfamily A-like protein 1